MKKVSSSETTIFVYDASGQLVAEYSTQISAAPQVSYLTTDHLGSPRVITDQFGNVTTRKDYAAFGDETFSAQRTVALGYDGMSETRKGYTGYEKDDESGLDFAQARYYNSRHGRFTSADPLMASANVKNPQTFNRYSYVLNSPYKFTDPLGLISSSTGACGQWCPGGERNSLGGGGAFGSSSFDDDGSSDFGFAQKLDNHNQPSPTSSFQEIYDSTLQKIQERSENRRHFEPELRLSGGTGARRPVRRSPPARPAGRPRRPSNQPRQAPRQIGPGLNEENARRDVESSLQNIVLTAGGVPFAPKKGEYHRHHIFPQEFRERFERAGVPNIDQFIMTIPARNHQDTHSGIGLGRGGFWNSEWRNFFNQTRQPTREQIMNQGQQMVFNFTSSNPTLRAPREQPSIRAIP